MVLIQEILSRITIVLLLSAVWMTRFLCLEKCLKALNSDVVKFSDGLWSLEKLSFQGKVMSSDQVFIKDKSTL